MLKKSNLVKKIVSIGIISAISISTLGIGVASAAYATNVSAGGGTWYYSTSPTYAESDYFHKTKNIVLQLKLSGRVIGTDGDTIELKDGYVFKNNIQLSYTYSESENKKYVLKNNEYFVIGDNFNASTDSRSFGIINNDVIEGKII